MRGYSKAAIVISAAAAVVAVPVCLLVATASAPSEPLPRWSCNHDAPPVAEVPHSLAKRAGFATAAELRSFVESHDTQLRATYFAVQLALAAAERKAIHCFHREHETAVSAQGAKLVEAKLIWHLRSDGEVAKAGPFEIDSVNGSKELSDIVRRCLREHVTSKQQFVVSRPTVHRFVQYDGVFPFFRKLRFMAQDGHGAGPLMPPARASATSR